MLQTGRLQLEISLRVLFSLSADSSAIQKEEPNQRNDPKKRAQRLDKADRAGINRNIRRYSAHHEEENCEANQPVP